MNNPELNESAQGTITLGGLQNGGADQEINELPLPATSSVEAGGPKKGPKLETKRLLENEMNIGPKRKIAYLGIAALMLAMNWACAPKNSIPSATGAKPGDATTATAPAAPSAEGTVSGGGGTGLFGRVFETYAVDVTQSEEWKEHIAPIDAHMRSLIAEKDRKESSGLAEIAKSLRWFIAPIQLDQLKKSTLGVDFIQDPVQTLAFQYKKEVWIQKDKWDLKVLADGRPDTRARATEIIHEIMVQVYMWKFMPFEELCMATTKKPQDCAKFLVIADATTQAKFAPEPRRALNADDYAHIRAMTTFFVQNGTVATSAEIDAELVRQAFDKRLRDQSESKPPTENPQELERFNNAKETVDLDRTELLDRLADYESLGRLPNSCVEINGESKSVAKCGLRFEKVSTGTGEKKITTTTVSLILPNGLKYEMHDRVGVSSIRSVKASFFKVKFTEAQKPGYMTSLGYFYPASGPTTGAEAFQCNLQMDLDLADVLVVACDPLKVINVQGTMRTPVGNDYFASLVQFQIGTPKDRNAFVMIDSKLSVPAWGRSRMSPSRMADYFDYQLEK